MWNIYIGSIDKNFRHAYSGFWPRGWGFECISVKKENLTKIFFTEYEKNFKTFVKNDIC